MVDYQTKYESLLRNVLTDLNTDVLTAQARAEKNAEVSTAYCTALKERLHERDRELDETRRQLDALREEHARAQTELVEARAKLEMYAEREKLPNAVGRDSEQPIAADSTCMSGDGHVTNAAVRELLGGLTAMSVSRCVQSSGTTTFHCQVTDGSLTGHTFTLTLDPSIGEFTYDPVKASLALSPDSMFTEPIAFPDYMQSRFLLNLLSATLIQPCTTHSS